MRLLPQKTKAPAAKFDAVGFAPLRRGDRADAKETDLAPGDQVSPRFGYDLSRIPVFPDGRVTLQPKLTIGAPGDAYEQEADRVAEHVMRTPEEGISTARAPLVQRKTADHGQAGTADVPEIVHAVLRSPGQPLDADTRAFMEPRFGQDFSAVRVHTDARAAEAAASIGARAFTSGRSIAVGASEYAPQNQTGRQLLSHELTHVIQQTGNSYLKNADGEIGGTGEIRGIAGITPATPGIQRKIVDQKGHEIKFNLEHVKPGDVVTPEFPEKASKEVRREVTRIANAMAKTPSGLASLKRWVELPGSIELDYTTAVLYDDDEQEVHGFSKGTDPNVETGKTEVVISGAAAGGEKDRYALLEGEQLWGAIATHESVHQSKENMALKQRYTELQEEIEGAGAKIKKNDPRRQEATALKRELEIAPVQLELTSLIEFDVLYPDKAGNWKTRNFEAFLGKERYKKTVESAVDGLVSRGYLDNKDRKTVTDVYLGHHKRTIKKK